MNEDDRAKSDARETESEEYMKFKAAMQQILSVKKIDIEHKLPKMFRERKSTTKKTARKRETT